MASTESEARIDAEASAVPSESAPAEGAPADKSAKSQPATAPGGQPPQHRGGGKKKDKKKKKAKQEYLKCPKVPFSVSGPYPVLVTPPDSKLA